MAAPMDDSTADAPAIPVGLKKILIKDREFLNVANSWVDKVKQQKVSSALWNRIGAKGSNCPFSVRTKFGKQTNIAALFKKTTKLYGKLASSKGTKSREMIVTAHKFKKALQGCFASRAQVALIDHLFSDSGYQKSEIDAISRLQSSILKIKPRRSATYDVCKVKYSTGRTGMCALDMITEHPTKITKVFGLSKDILPTSDKFSRPKLGYLQNGKPAAIVISMPILWFTVAMKGSPSYVNGGSSGEIYFSSLGGVWEKYDKIVEGLSNQSLTEICHFLSAEEKANEVADFEGKICKSHSWDQGKKCFITETPNVDEQMNWNKAEEAFKIAYAQPRIMISANTSIHNK
ncbi:hypothetical protein HELRODRAFT_175276 [Helobdella robusta]|uniref:Uncharacterized protein n=1 Tax=Helobdella robusta TaxID=6412 RepID=T1F933_HELRO|nr:hypothetical protein HELRODRAFT_175276 [Helobdella robusta]ESO00794.1 hypothetical protein HELRODRAFT_175276 [Helobdella robusta]